MNAVETYSVVGVRDDGVRVVIDERIASDRAHLVRLLLLVANAYPDVIVEPDQPKE